MRHGKHWIWLALLVAGSGLTCAPRDEGTRDAPPVDKPRRDKSTNLNGKDLKAAVEAALTEIKNRTLVPGQGFWTIFHAILGMGFDTELLVGKNGKRVRAIDYILDDQRDADGKEMPGRSFLITAHGADVESAFNLG